MRIKKLAVALTSGLLALVIAAGSSVPSFAADDDGSAVSELTLAAMEDDYYSFDPSAADLMTFSSYYDIYSGCPRPDATVTVRGSDYTSAEGDITTGDYTADGVTHKNALVWESASGSVSYRFEIPETGIYCLGVTYCGMKSGSSAVELSVAVDGEVPYETAARISLPRVWVNEQPIYKDSRGNQVRPAQVQKEMWQDRLFGDTDGLFSEPLFFYLEKGSHDITFTSGRAQVAIDSFRFCNPAGLPSYSEYTASVKAERTPESTPDRKFRIEGENAAFKTDASLCPAYDNTTYLMSPADPRKILYNSIGGSNWSKALQSITWTVTREDIGNSGWYRIGIKYRQDQMRGLNSNRRIYIDGKVICKELDSVGFSYGKDWKMKTLETEDGEDIYVYLDASRDHTITLEAVPGEIGSFMRRLDSSVADLNKFYRRILMITGPVPDTYTDYYVHERIPELVGEFSRIAGDLEDIQDGIEDLSGAAGSEASVLERMAVILRKCVKKPLKIPSYLPRIKDDLTSVSAWMRDYRGQPLEVDFIEFVSAGENFTSCRKEVTKSLKFGFDAFIGSFLDDYTTVSDVSGKGAVEVWVALGRDQAQVVSELTKNQFTPESGIPVSVELVSGGIIEASLAGKGPDVALFVGGEFPVNLAARGLLTDVAQFSDYGEVSQRFQKNAMTQYSYNGGVYGLPISQTFPMLFYRTDVLSELGFTHPPETWQDLIDMLPAIQRSYMSVGLILPPTNISPATEAGHTFAMLLLQKGMNYYNDEQTATTFSSAEAVQAFEQWTDFYTKYSFEQTYDAFNRFRTGEYPLVIANYTFCNQLEAAAPEIKGLWAFCPVPGTPRADGTISHAANSSGSGAIIFSKADNKENCWEFIKWFTSAETQVQYGTQTEGLLGVLGRFDTANVEALGQLSWSEDELKRLRAQQDELAEIPVLPSSYAVTRNIMNAFRETVNNMANPRDTLIWYDRDINEEIERKRKNLSS
ncbi:MAG: extracellular solute-binding protein [Ruminococcus sp.]|nr:extracellular solute-binding protein [Ruminococcus sp.]